MGPLEVSNLAALAEIISVEECQVVWFVQKIMQYPKKGQWSDGKTQTGMWIVRTWSKFDGGARLFPCLQNVFMCS